MLRVGLTGGYATGKSYVASELERLGANVIYADTLGHEVLLPSGEGYTPALERFGPGILGDNGLIDRRKLAHIVFDNPELLKQLSEIVHPAVYRLESKLVDAYKERNPHAVVVTEAAILIETGRYKTFHRLIVTTCSPETQIARGMKRDGLSREEVLNRMQRQIPASDKETYAHYVVNTDAPKPVTSARVKEIYSELAALAAKV
jgi:dephospho-CoA kinase